VKASGTRAQAVKVAMFPGGFLPILKGKKTSKLRPEFVIFDPTKGNLSSFSLEPAQP
jgi:hypothetical protein